MLLWGREKTLESSAFPYIGFARNCYKGSAMLNYKRQKIYMIALIICLGSFTSLLFGEEKFELRINPRPLSAASGEEFARSIESLELDEREAVILKEVRAGNIPPFQRNLVSVETVTSVGKQRYTLTFFVMPDYLTIGSNADHFHMPMTPMLAQKIVDEYGGILPTRKMVDRIWEASAVKLAPEPIPPSPEMVTVGVFREHNDLVHASRAAVIDEHPLGTLVSGNKKDIILSNRLASKPDKVIIYGWHYPVGEPIQPLYTGHVNWYADYSHGVRLVLNKCILNGVVTTVDQILSDPVLYQLLSDENGPMETTRYDTSMSNYP